MKNINPISGLFLLGFIAVFLYIINIIYESKHPCIKYEDEITHHEAYDRIDGMAFGSLIDGRIIHVPASDSVTRRCVSHK